MACVCCCCCNPRDESRQFHNSFTVDLQPGPTVSIIDNVCNYNSHIFAALCRSGGARGGGGVRGGAVAPGSHLQGAAL